MRTNVSPLRGQIVGNAIYVRRPSNELIATVLLYPPKSKITFHEQITGYELFQLSKSVERLCYSLSNGDGNYDSRVIRFCGLDLEGDFDY